MTCQFTHPQWLWLLPVSLVWIAWLARTSDVQTDPWRRRISLALRSAVAALIILAIAGLQWLSAIDGMNVFFLLDKSESVSPANQNAARQWINRVTREKKEDDRAGLIVFGSEAVIDASPSASLDARKIQTVVPGSSTDIGAAIRLAAADFPEHGQRRAVLISDGNENYGDAMDAAISARAVGASVDIVPVIGEERNDVAVERLQLPSKVSNGQTFYLKVFVHADRAGPATVRLYRNDQFLGSQDVNLDAGKNLFTFPQSPREAGFYNYDVQVDARDDSVPGNNRASGFVHVKGIPRVLIISTDQAADQPLVNALKSSEFETRLVAVNAFPGSLAELQSYDSVVLCNVPAGDLSRYQQEMLESAVRDFGTGLVCVGGDESYAAGAYRGTPLARVLPVDVELSSKKVLPPGALVLVIDRSGSMMGQKIEMARQAAIGAIQALGPNDFAGVIAFDSAEQVVAPIQHVGDRKALISAIMNIEADGGTVMHPAMARAHEMLRGVNASFKHCIILTDGVSAPGDFAGLTRAMVGDRITVSTVGIGEEIDGHLLAEIADIGKGRFYHAQFPGELPQIFIKETAVILKSAIDEDPFQPRLVSATEPIHGIGIESCPKLLGCVVTEPQPRAETAIVTEKGDPLLAHWQYGLGRSVAFTSDARAKWAKNWLAWSGYERFWRQIVQWSLRRLDNPGLATEITLDNGQGHIQVEAVNEKGGFRNFLNLEAGIVGPGHKRQNVQLRQTGAGFYEATFKVDDPGLYLCNLLQMEKGIPQAGEVVGASWNYSPELATSVPNFPLLRRIAETTGGKVLDPEGIAANPFLHDRVKTQQPHDLWQWLLRLAVVLFVCDVGVRRIQLDSEQLRELRGRVLRIFGIRHGWSAATVASMPSLESLLASRERSRSESQASAHAPMPASAQSSAISETSEQISTESAGEAIDAPATEPPPVGEGGTTNRLLAAKRRAQSRTRK